MTAQDRIPPLASERLSGLIGLIYDCAIEPDRWPEAMHDICLELDCFIGAIYLVEWKTARVRFLRHWNAQAEGIAMLENPGKEDLALIYSASLVVRSRPIDEPLVLSRDLSKDILSRVEHFRQWAELRGVCDVVQAMVLREPHRIGIFSANRHVAVGPATDREIDIMRLLAPHIRRAVTIGDILDLKKIEVQALAATLDKLTAGVVVVAEANRILHANLAARYMFAAGSPVRSEGGRLTATGAKARAELAKAIELARGNEAGIGASGIGVPLGDEADEPTVAHVLPLAQGDLRTRLVPKAMAAIFITSAEGAATANIGTIAAAFRLTPAETRVLERLLRGATLVDTAAALNIAETTAKTHLSRIFAKTGVSRQSDLVTLVDRLTPPLREV